MLGLIVGTKTGLVGLVVDELLDTFLASLVVMAVGRFLGADQVILGIVVGHLPHAANGILGGFERHGVLLQQNVGDIGYTRFQLRKRQGLVDETPFGSFPAVNVFAGQRVVHGVAEGGEFGRYLGGATAGQDAPVDLAQSEFGLIGGKGEVAGEKRPVTAAEAPAVHHGDGRFLIPAQTAPPAIAFALRLSCALQTAGLGLAEVFLEIHARGPGRPLTGQNQNTDIGPKLEFVQNFHHAPVERGAHGVAFLRAIEADPSDAGFNGKGDGIFFGMLCCHDGVLLAVRAAHQGERAARGRPASNTVSLTGPVGRSAIEMKCLSSLPA
ncbi:hypothetical protein RHSP_36785 [Rhizobium freirei PRF 81]|uniref:Uncharacterized protein n=1 Tax=Rhizobium freirei PRF 81 TaxID=363754 RepID=N6UHL1_9HYPH|nr:hypothetical protein RHSP_36785 [Rhizobium freirei PRF 81]